jgi:hypothetical protein
MMATFFSLFSVSCSFSQPSQEPGEYDLELRKQQETKILAPAKSDTGADQFIWGTEGQGLLISDYAQMSQEEKNIVNIVNDALGMKYVKIRIRLPMDGKFSPDMCIDKGAYYSGSQSNCSSPRAIKFNLDHTARLFKENGWSMIPMISHAGAPRLDYPIDDQHIELYVNFVDWFVGRYREKANIKYVELVNAPSFTWKGSAEQLLELNNRTYQRIKSKYPDLKIGTPGFEYFSDASRNTRGGKHQVVRDYFLQNNAKFDFWAIHGYPTRGESGLKEIYPPTKIAKRDKYTGIYGLSELRRTMDKMGWRDREIIDTEHTGILGPGVFDKEVDRLNAAYLVQQTVVKRTLEVDGRKVLSGLIALKLIPRCERLRGKGKMGGGMGPPPMGGGRPRGDLRGGRGFSPREGFSPRRNLPTGETKKKMWGGECAWGSLNPDGSVSLSVRAVGLLQSKMLEYNHVAHISGEFDREDEPWIEKFAAANRELYIFFKPFEYRRGQRIEFDNTALNYTLQLDKMPTSTAIIDVFGNKNVIRPSNHLTLKVRNSPHFLELQY